MTAGKKAKKFRTPAGYVAPLRSRKKIAEWLLNHRSYEDDRFYQFAWDVKCPHVDLDFESLFHNPSLDIDPEIRAMARWKVICEQIYEKNEQYIWERAIEDARDSVRDDDAHRMLWDDDKTIENLQWSFNGRSGGHLCLETFEFLKDWEEVAANLRSEVDDPTEPVYEFDFLRKLYRFIVQCDHDFRPEAVKSEVEFKAAWCLFEGCPEAQDGLEECRKILHPPVPPPPPKKRLARWLDRSLLR